ncbi:MAG: Thioredoxin domain-containing protein [Oscillospiraceae bacterium]
MNTKKRIVRIIVPILILAALTVIWMIKTQSAPASEETNSDFALETTSVDLETLTSYNLPIIIDFGSDSCIPCQQMAPVLETMNAEMQGKAIIKFVDVWKHAEAADGFPVQVIPTQVFINSDGTPYVPSEEIDVEFTMYSYQDTGEHAFTVHQGGLTEEQMRAILADMGVAQ